MMITARCGEGLFVVSVGAFVRVALGKGKV